MKGTLNKQNFYLPLAFLLYTCLFQNYAYADIFDKESSIHTNPLLPDIFTEGPLFTSMSIWLQPVSNADGDWGDYDNDGDLDLVLTGWGSTIVYRNNYPSGDTANFTNINAGLLGLGEGSVDWGDFDNDGDLDILLTGNFTGPVSLIYRNDNGVFTNINANLNGVANGCGIWGDFDNDGDLDILLTGGSTYGSVNQIYYNVKGIFNSPYSLTSQSYNNAKAGDYDNDGDLDILLTGNNSPGIFRNDNGTFTNITANVNASLVTVNWGSADWGDYDNDGDLDILLTGNAYNGPLSIVYRNDNGKFTNISAGLTGVNYSSGVWGDYDNDGDQDILLTGSSVNGYITYLYKNDNGSFTNVNAGLPAISNSYADWADYDNDGDLDLILAGNEQFLGGFTKILRNNSVNKNSNPTAPSALSISQSRAESFTFSWSPGNDTETPQTGLSYNFYLIKNAQDTLQFAPADLNTGFNRLAESGKIQGLSARFTNPGSGSYKLGVQTIDAGLKGSIFATYDFTVSNQAPGQPVAIYPANGSSVFADSARLKWNSIDYDHDTLTYTVFFGKEGELNKIFENISGDSVIVRNLLPGAIYNWQISARDKYGVTTTGTVWKFYTAISESEPNNSFPEADSTIIGSAFYGKVGSSSDKEDYFCIKLPYNCLISLKVENLNKTGLANGGLGNIKYYHHSLTRTIIDQSNLDAGEIYTSGRFLLYANEKCYVRIAPRLIDDIVPYRISYIIETPSISDNPEPNNTMQTAYPLYRDSVSSYTGFWGDREDWYNIFFNGNGTFKIILGDIQDNLTIQDGLYSLKVYSPSGSLITQKSDWIANGDSVITNLIGVTQGQNYFVNVTPRDSGSAAAYYIKIISDVQEIRDGWGPTIPEPVNIPDGSVDIFPGDTTLKWSCTHPGGKSLSYDLYLGSTPSPPLVSANLLATEWSFTGLEPRDSIYWKIVAHDQDGNTTSSKVYSFVVARDGYFTDMRDGNKYGYLTIGNQTWMAENLAYLPAVSPGSIGSLSNVADNSKYYYVYGYNGNDVSAAKATTNYQTYGVLYNWPAAMNGKTSNNNDQKNIQGACPSGWHLPSSPEWEILVTWLTNNNFGYGGSGNDIAKSISVNSGWINSTNAGSVGNLQELNNSSYLSISPSGKRTNNSNEYFNSIGNQAFYWTSSNVIHNDYEALSRYLSSWDNMFYLSTWQKCEGFSIRCIKDRDYLSSFSIIGNGDFSYRRANSGNITRTIWIINKGTSSVPADSLSSLGGPYTVTAAVAPIPAGDTLIINITLHTAYQLGAYPDTLSLKIENQYLKIPVNSIITNNLPPQLSLVSPANSISDVDTVGLRLLWTGTDAEGESLLYDVYFGPDSDLQLISASQNASSFQLPVLSPETNYSWYIRARDTYGNITISDTNYFKTWTNDPPTLTILAPSDNSTDIPLDFELRWYAQDDENDPLQFDIYFGTTANPGLIESGYTQQSYKLTGLSKNTIYYWKVRVRDSFGNIKESSVLKFITSNKPTGWIKITVTDSNKNGIADASYTIGSENFVEGKTSATGNSGQIMLLTGKNRLTVRKTGYFGYLNTDIIILEDHITDISIILPPIGDYNSDNKTDQIDIDSLITHWRNKDYRYELGPAEGTAPDFLVRPDGLIDFEDLMVFSQMWNYRKTSANGKGEPQHSYEDFINLYSASSITGKQTSSYVPDEINLDFKIHLNKNILSSKLIISYDNTNLQYEGYDDRLSDKLNTIFFINNEPENGYLEILTGFLDNNNRDEILDLVSLKFRKKMASFILPVAKYELHRDDQKNDKGDISLNINGDIRIYPNPANTKVTIEVLNNMLPSYLSIYNSRGQLVHQQDIREMKQEVVLSYLKSGIYIFKVTTGNMVNSRMIIKN